jgi:predicted transcriptional regulator YdeE
MIKPGTSVYCQGVEVPADFKGQIPQGYEIIELPPCKMMIFQGPPYEDDKFEEAISELWEEIAAYNPELYGFSWDDNAAPRFQFCPIGARGYIEGKPVKTAK